MHLAGIFLAPFYSCIDTLFRSTHVLMRKIDMEHPSLTTLEITTRVRTGTRDNCNSHHSRSHQTRITNLEVTAHSSFLHSFVFAL
jgi:hypothetical protein